MHLPTSPHTPPGTERPWFSYADDSGDARLIPSLFAQMPGPHGSLLIAGATRVPSGRAWTGAGDSRPCLDCSELHLRRQLHQSVGDNRK